MLFELELLGLAVIPRRGLGGPPALIAPVADLINAIGDESFADEEAAGAADEREGVDGRGRHVKVAPVDDRFDGKPQH